MFFFSCFKYCFNCGYVVDYCILVDDNCECVVCLVCLSIYYQNLLNVVGMLLVWEVDGCVLLCLCVIEFCCGLWMLLVGFMEFGEIIVEGVLCEICEEVGVDVEMGLLYMMFNVVCVGQVYLFYFVWLWLLEFVFGFELLEVRFFIEVEVFWDDIVFKIMCEMLCCFFEDWCVGCGFGLYEVDIF